MTFWSRLWILRRPTSKAPLLRQIHLCVLTHAAPRDVGRDYHQQFVVLSLLGVSSRDLVQKRNLAETGNAAQVAGFAAADLARDYRRLPILKTDTAFILAIANHRHAI